MPAIIERLESQIGELHREMAEDSFYRQPGQRIAEQQAQLAKLEADLAVNYRRWEELEQRAE